jgi:hypothetical protein
MYRVKCERVVETERRRDKELQMATHPLYAPALFGSSIQLTRGYIAFKKRNHEDEALLIHKLA